MAKMEWEIGHLHLRLGLIWSMAVSSLKVRIGRSFLTALTICTATSFMMYLLASVKGEGESEGQSWTLMLALALVVSAAGVLNAMLMSVSQRYREIGTIKCLGALDSLVLFSVLLEAAFLGLCGAVVGVVFGFVIALLLGMADFGWAVFSMVDWPMLPLKVLGVFAVGMVLTTLGAAVPAWVASKMPPVDAMRGEK
jgi:ABC-type antimicrobial peptide transport system permease subunit